MNVTQLFDLSLSGRRDKTALEFGAESWTFGQLDEQANQMAYALIRRGLTAGDRLAVYLENSPSFIQLYLACLRLGVIFVPVNILYREREITHILSDAEPKALVASGNVPGDFPFWEVDDLVAEANEQTSLPLLDNPTTGDSPAALVYTSGTTGASKGAILTHNNFIANAVNLVACWQITEADRFWLPLPLFHVHGLGNGIHCWLLSGCRMRLLERFNYQTAANDLIQFKPTLFFGVPTIYIRLLDWPDEMAHALRSTMRLFVSGSAPLPAQVMEAFDTKFGHVILERYGMTETLMNISNPYIGERRPGTIGFPLPGISARILDPEGQEVAVDVEGEVHIKGPNVCAGYWKRDEATKQAFTADGYFKTGDMGVVSADGYVTLRGRKSDLIISGGFNIYPREIEEFLLEQPDVSEAAVVGVPHARRGEVPVAYIVPNGTFDAESLSARCQAGLASFKLPKAFVAVDSLPRTALGKVQKHLLPQPESIG
ncbi:class I adenylate-forming enzyme family protein [Fibrella forsythiae]|uniref:AMP-binding protein n=1 Tax=Fibrella forsythiae TaxID=2817061 RepID=A0ABS3JFD9_9BACT|nr:AMP-binding protein [Fibrella forsythiae]MBO0948708.1 AMP-binding protein [Fibrella forsythiae]